MFDTRNKIRTRADDSEVCRIKYIGRLKGGRVVVDSNVIYFYVSNTLDSLIGSDGVLDLTSTACDTVKELIDVINDVAHYRVWPVDLLPGDATSNLLVALASNAATNSNLIDERGIAILSDVSQTLVLKAGLQWCDIANRKNDKDTNARGFFLYGELEIKSSTSNVPIRFDLLACDDEAGTTRSLFGKLLVSGSETKTNKTIKIPGEAVESFGKPGERLVARVSGFSVISTGAAAHIMNVIGKVEAPQSGGGYYKGDTETPLTLEV